MTAYRLSSLEVWTLATLVTLPIEGDSVLGVWLADFPPPDVEVLVTNGLNRLQAKGYLGLDGKQVPDDLLEALTLLALAKVTVTTILRYGGTLAHTHFAQVADRLAQYMPEDGSFYVHSPESAISVAGTLVPDWFQVQARENLHLQLPLGAYAMLVSACELQDVHALIGTSEAKDSFSRAELVDHMMDRETWLAGLSEAGVAGVPGRDQFPVGAYLDLLVSRGLLTQVSGDRLVVGAQAMPLREALGDPALATLTVSLQTSDGAFSRTGSFIHGGERLFQFAYVMGGDISIDQLSAPHEAIAWIGALLSQGAQVPVTVTPWEQPGTVAIEASSGVSRASAPKFCPHCGAPVVRPTAKFCARCGRPLR